jgi:hypothetical protein
MNRLADKNWQPKPLVQNEDSFANEALPLASPMNE